MMLHQLVLCCAYHFLTFLFNKRDATTFQQLSCWSLPSPASTRNACATFWCIGRTWCEYASTNDPWLCHIFGCMLSLHSAACVAILFTVPWLCKAERSVRHAGNDTLYPRSLKLYLEEIENLKLLPHQDTGKAIARPGSASASSMECLSSSVMSLVMTIVSPIDPK